MQFTEQVFCPVSCWDYHFFLSYFQHPIIFLCLVHKIMSQVLYQSTFSYLPPQLGRSYFIGFCIFVSESCLFSHLYSTCAVLVSCHSDNPEGKIGVCTLFWVSQVCSGLRMHGLLSLLKGSALGSRETRSMHSVEFIWHGECSGVTLLTARQVLKIFSL